MNSLFLDLKILSNNNGNSRIVSKVDKSISGNSALSQITRKMTIPALIYCYKHGSSEGTTHYST